MTVTKNASWTLREQRGASILEVLLSMAIVALITPFLYNQISDSTAQIRNIKTAKEIQELREPALNFVRLNQDTWPAFAQIQLSDDELKTITETSHAGFIDKYSVRGATITDIYLAFRLDGKTLRSAQIAKHIGDDAAIVDDSGVANGASWAMGAPDLNPGDLVYRITYNFSGDDNSKYLHRGTSGDDELNVMMRTMNLGKFDLFNVGTASAQSSKITDSVAAFTESSDIASGIVYFTGGANADGSAMKIESIKVGGDITGFRNIVTKKLNASTFSTNGSIIADRAKVNNSVNVGKTLTLKSDTARTITGFAGITAHSLATPFVLADELIFNNNFGLTISGELLVSTTAPLKIGSWIFPSTTPPKFSNFTLSRASTPQIPKASEFDKIMKDGWRDAPRVNP